MKTDITYLTLDYILAIHYTEIEKFGGGHGVRDVGLLESALYRPQSAFGGEELYPTIFDKAAALGHSLIINHPFVSGNKPTGIVSMSVFLQYNGIEINTTQEEFLQLALDIESKKMTIKQLAQWLEKHTGK